MKKQSLIQQLRAEIIQRQQVEETLKERLGFEALLSDLSVRFVNVSQEEIDREIEQALKQILAFFQVDRCALVRVVKGKNTLEITHIALREGVSWFPAHLELSRDMFPWVFKRVVERHEVVAFESLEELPGKDGTTSCFFV